MDGVTLRHPVVPARTGVWAGIAAITMMFAAFLSALLVRQGEADWVRVELPPILYANTLLLLASSATLERARARPGTPSSRWLSLTLALGLLFVAGQILAWRALAAQGLFLATSPASAFFYLLTAVHGTHLLGGIAALVYVRRRAQRDPGPGAVGALGAASGYWHFLTALWVCLLLILTLRL
jgi:cytochrome c oxidase subunit 3